LQVGTVPHRLTLEVHLPSGHRTGAVLGQLGNTRQLSAATAQEPSGQRTGVSAGQLMMEGQLL
jgi:hypothetical protein